MAAVDNTLGVPDLADVELLGAGGFSVVYSATHTVFDRRVAVKILTSVATDDDRRRFEQECRAMGRLSSDPNVVTVHQAGYTTSGRPYLIMELIEDGSLADHLNRHGPLRWDDAIELLLPVCRAIDHAHREGILHRDIKPDNILLDGGIPKLTDFGIARFGDSTGGASTQVSASWLHTPPETFQHTRDERSDVYALASTLYTAVRGHPPMWRDGDESVYPAIQRLMVEHGPPPLPPELAPPELVDLLERSLARDPDRRPQSANQLAAELAAILGVAPPPMATVRSAPSRETTAGRWDPDPHGATTVLPVADAGGRMPAGHRSGQHRTEVLTELPAPAGGSPTGPRTPDPAGNRDGDAHRPPPRSGAVLALFAGAVMLLAASAAAGTWLTLDGNRSPGTAPSVEGGAGEEVAGIGADGATSSSASTSVATSTTVPDGDGDGVPDGDDACPEQVGVDSGGGCPDTDGDTVVDAEDACPVRAGETGDGGCPVSVITVELIRFVVVEDCDSGLFGGDGEFVLTATVTTERAGVAEEVLTAERRETAGDGSEITVGESTTVTLPDQPGQVLRVEFSSVEEDGFPEPPRDDRLGADGRGSATGRHEWVAPDGWTGVADPAEGGVTTLVAGDDGSGCQTQLDYRLTFG